MPIFAGAATATPPAPAPERDGDHRTSWSSSQSRRPSRWARSPPSRCLPNPATAASAEAATPPPRERRARAAPRPLSGRRLDCGQQAKASAERRDPALRLPRSSSPASAAAPALATTSPNSAAMTLAPARSAGVREPAILLATGVVHAATASSSTTTAERALASPWLCHRSIVPPAPDGPARSGIRAEIDALLRAGGIFLRDWPANLDHKERWQKPRICRAFVSTATGIRTRVSAVRGRRPSPLDDSGA